MINPDIEESMFCRNFEDYDRYGVVTQTMSWPELWREEAYAEKAVARERWERLERQRIMALEGRPPLTGRERARVMALVELARENGWTRYVPPINVPLSHTIYRIR